MKDAQHLVIGMAGHIDHGKTALVKRLTGIDTDRLPEEKRRGISIDLGFAHWSQDGFQFAIVDVPGHQRFVRNMVAGATGIDIGLLVVAADDGVMPQTREHLEIMDLLGVRTGLVAITKIDMVEPGFVDLVRAEINELAEGTFLSSCPIVGVSSATGSGFADLGAAICGVARRFSCPAPREFFRMPIDRVFSLEGHGTIVTGTVLGGEVRAGDMVELLPSGNQLRVRRVQNFGADRDVSGPRQRTAVNLVGIRRSQVRRGQELASPGFLRPSRRALVALRNLPTSPIALKDRIVLQLHLGTSDTAARVVLKGAPLEPGACGYAELRLQNPVVSQFGQRFILRTHSPVRTVGGGTIVDPRLPARVRINELRTYGANRNADDELGRLSFFLAESNSVEGMQQEAEWRCGIPVSRFRTLIGSLVEQGDLIALTTGGTRTLVHRDRFDKLVQAVLRKLSDELESHRPLRTLPENHLLSVCAPLGKADLIQEITDQLVRAGRLARAGSNIGLAQNQVQLTRQQALIQGRLIEAIERAGLSPPTLKELAKSLDQNPKELEALLLHGAEDGRVVRVSKELFFVPRALAHAHRSCRDVLNRSGTATISQLRQVWGTSRKYAAPLCEYFDTQQITVRQEDLRSAGPKLEAVIWPDESTDVTEGGTC